MSRESDENTRRLQQCKQHRFGRFQGMDLPLKCDRCKGTMSLQDILHYRDGYAAAGGNPNDILILDDAGEA